MSDHLKRFSENIKKTGFPLEFATTEALRKHGWSVITNKYYIDDVQEYVDAATGLGFRGIHFESPELLESSLAAFGVTPR